MATTFTKIASVTVGSGGAATIGFTSIPTTYTDLVIKMSIRGSRSAIYETIKTEFNGVTTGYTTKQLYGDGATVASTSISAINFDADGSTATANTFGNIETYITNYTSANYKSISIDSVMENNATTAYAEFNASLWSNTAAINSILMTPTVGSFAQYSTATLYGIKSS